MLSSKTESQNSESTASSVASGSSEVINTMDKNVNITEEINKEVDKLFGPALERTKSGSDLEVIAPLRNKRRQYKSQEVLPIDKSLQIHNESIVTTPSNQNQPSQENINEIDGADRFKIAQVPIMYANQRAEIVASVTERLYSKLKKKEEAAASKMEAIVDKKIVEPLSELRICTNARQRLMELSQKALRNKRRIGIPAYTQTRIRVTRVRDQGIDVQTDLGSYILRNEKCYTLRRDVATETMPMTPRCKEIAVGPKCGSLEFRDRSTITENKKVVYKNSFMMTDIIAKCNRCSQTPIVPPPRRKKRSSMFTKYIRSDEDSRNDTEECPAPPIISINISQQYPVDSESQSSDENTEREVNKTPTIAAITPDLLTNHNTTDTTVHENNDSDPICEVENVVETERLQNDHHIIQAPVASHEKESEDFPDSENCSLPRVGVDSCRSVNQEEIKDMILGRNANMYPYNIVLSPPRERDNIKRIVKFKEVDVASALSVASQTSWEWDSKTKCGECSSDLRSEATNSEKEQETGSSIKDASEQNTSDSTDSNKVETNSFIWKKVERGDHYHKTVSSTAKGYTPVYKTSARYGTIRSKLYREFLGLQNDENDEYEPQISSLINLQDSSESTENEQSQYKFKLRKQFFENKFEHPYNYKFLSLEKKLLDSCDTLDATVNRYQNYLSGYRDNGYGRNPSMRTPKEYLQHLVQLRREVVKAECDTTDSSVGK